MTRMKDSGIEWIGEVPEDWVVTKFKFLGTAKNGLTYSPENIVEQTEGVLVLRSGNIQNNKLVFDNNVYVNSQIEPSIFLKKGDILITARNGSANLIGKNAIVEESILATYGAFMMVFRVNKRMKSKFAYYLMNSSFDFYRTFFTTSTVNQLTAGIFYNIEVPLPTIVEQTQIADFLDKKVAQLDKVKSLLEEQINTLENYRQSLIYETVTKGLDKNAPLKDSGVDWIGQIPEGWGTGKIKYYAEISAGSTPDRTNELFWNGDIPWMASGEVNQGVVTHTAEKITKLGLRNTSTKLLSKGTVMLALNGQGKTKGTAAILNIETASNQSLASFDVNNEVVNGYYLYYYFVSSYSNIRGLKGEDRDGLNLKLVSNIEIPLPNIDEQLKIADFLDKKTEQINQMIAIKKEQIENINKQRQTLIYDYVTGKRRV